MYIPSAFDEPDLAKLHVFMRRYAFAVVTSRNGDRLLASHLPILLDAEATPRGHLLGHMARANPQWKRVEGEVMVIFSGPHAYVSPAWYAEGGTVPTWNYVAVHAYGTFQVVEDRDALLDILRRSVVTYEARRTEPWTFDETAPHVEAMLKAIVGFRIEITRLEGKWKLSQNHSIDRRLKVVEGLKERDDDDAKAIAGLIEEGLPKPGWRQVTDILTGGSNSRCAPSFTSRWAGGA